MGVPSGGGQSLGHAQGRISISTEDVRRAQREVEQASRGMSKALNALGIGLGARELVQFAVEADKVATSYRRQMVAARNLAGSQSELNELLRVYEQATGGAVSKAASLQNVTKLMAVGFGDSAEELDKFARAIRGISIAMGVTQDFATQNLILDLFSQRGARLDQLGLEYQLVRKRAEELQAADSNLTKEMAYQQAVLEQAEERFGALADSAEGAATGVEDLRKEWDNLMLSVGATGAIDFVAQAMTEWLKQATEDVAFLKLAIIDLGQAFGLLPRSWTSSWNPAAPQLGAPPWMASVDAARNTVATPRFDKEQTAAMVEWHRETLDIERQAARDRLDATRQFEQQRTDAIRSYEQTIAREATDFARQRARSEEDYALGLERMHRDIASRELRQAEDLARSIGQARADSAERLADLEEEHARTLATRRADSAERIAEWEADRGEQMAERRRDSSERLIALEEEFNRERERAQRDSRERLHQAAGQFDAIAINREQRRLAREEEERRLAQATQLSEEQKRLAEGLGQLELSHRKRLDDEAKSLQKAVDQAQLAYNRQVANEKEALDKRISQANEAYALQLEDARAADEQRLEDMSADLELRQRREDEDRRIRLGRMAEDHEAQLGEMARQQEERLIQIAEQEQEARELLNDEFQKELDDLGIRTDAYAEKVKGFEEAAIEAFDNVWAHWISVMQGATQGPLPLNPMITPGQFPSLVPSTGGGTTNSTTVGGATVNINIYPTANQSPQEIGTAAIDEYMKRLGSPYQQ